MAINIPGGSASTNITTAAVAIAGEGSEDISIVLKDIQDDSILGNDVTWSDAKHVAASTAADDQIDTQHSDDTFKVHIGSEDVTVDDEVDKGGEVLFKYGYGSTADIRQASGAMVIDDVMQKISTKVQVAAQMLATINNINKTASRIISQG